LRLTDGRNSLYSEPALMSVFSGKQPGSQGAGQGLGKIKQI
jgi:hypothetical protein